MRLDKFLCETGYGTRSQVKKLIHERRVAVNGHLVTEPKQQIDEETDDVLVDRIPVRYEKYRYYMLNKPQGVISATEDKREKTVLTLIDDLPEGNPWGIFPVGRLDKDTEGLLLLTNDGALAHNLLSPKKHVEKVYLVKTKEPVTEAVKEKLESGVNIGDEKPTGKAKAEILSASEILLTISEGRYHQVKRMLLAVGNEVVTLKRIRFGGLLLDPDLKPGESRRLTAEEIEALCLRIPVIKNDMTGDNADEFPDYDNDEE